MSACDQVDVFLHFCSTLVYFTSSRFVVRVFIYSCETAQQVLDLYSWCVEKLKELLSSRFKTHSRCYHPLKDQCFVVFSAEMMSPFLTLCLHCGQTTMVDFLSWDVWCGGIRQERLHRSLLRRGSFKVL